MVERKTISKMIYIYIEKDCENNKRKKSSWLDPDDFSLLAQYHKQSQSFPAMYIIM